MTNEYTPTTEDVREGWVFGRTNFADDRIDRREAEAEFDRFVAGVRATALEEAAAEFEERSMNLTEETLLVGERYHTTADWLRIRAVQENPGKDNQ